MTSQEMPWKKSRSFQQGSYMFRKLGSWPCLRIGGTRAVPKDTAWVAREPRPMLLFSHVRGVAIPRVVSWGILGFVRKRRPSPRAWGRAFLPVTDLSWAFLPGTARGYAPAQTPGAVPYPEQRLASQLSARGDLDFRALPGWTRPQANTQPPAPGRLGPEEWARGGGWTPDGFPTHPDSGLVRQTPDLGF